VEDSRHALCCSANWLEIRNRRRDVDRILKCLPRDITLRPVVGWQLPVDYTEFVMDLIPPDQLDRQLCRQLAQAYLIQRGETASKPEFAEQIRKLLVFFMCECKDGHHCELSKCASLSFGLQEILRVRLSLTVELFADALHRNNRFTRWASGREDDNIFGSIGNAFNVCWKGMMALASTLICLRTSCELTLELSWCWKKVNSWMSYALGNRPPCCVPSLSALSPPFHRPSSADRTLSTRP